MIVVSMLVIELATMCQLTQVLHAPRSSAGGVTHLAAEGF